jgi:hypothetical protein
MLEPSLSVITTFTYKVYVYQLSVTMSRYTGSCSCGALEWSFTSTPTSTVHCWCKACRIAHAAPFVTWSVFPADSLRWQGRHDHLNNKGDNSDNNLIKPLKADGERETAGSLSRRRAGCCTRNACADCGTPVMITDQDVSGIISVPTALLEVDMNVESGTSGKDRDEAKRALMPTSHIWLEDRVDWCQVPDDGLPRFERYEEKDRNDKLVK